MNKITELDPFPKEIQSSAKCRLLHKMRPAYTGNKAWIESTKEWVEEIIWVCDECKIKNKENNEND